MSGTPHIVQSKYSVNTAVESAWYGEGERDSLRTDGRTYSHWSCAAATATATATAKTRSRGTVIV